MSRELDIRLSVAAAVAREAGMLAMTLFRDRLALETTLKGPQDYVTAADGKVERLILERLGSIFSGDTFLGEEGGGTISDSLWIIDPIDGTANFAHGVEHFAISIAFLERGTPALGVIYAPTTDQLYTAQKGRGAHRNSERIYASNCDDPARAYLEIGYSKRYPLANYLKLVEGVLARGMLVRWGGSAVLSLAHVADGRSEAYCDLHLNSWDAAAGILLVQEAGGWVNDFFDEQAITQGNAIAACSKDIRPEIIAAMKGLIPQIES